MYLEAVTISVNYGDFLAHTLPANKEVFNSMVVITTPEDKETQNVCKFHNVQCLTSRAFFENGDTFNKGRGINDGLDFLLKKDWVCHIDADMYLPPQSRRMLDNIHFDKSKVYGIDRLMCPDYESWSKFVSKPKLVYDNQFLIKLDAFQIAPRVVHYNETGYAPIGYFQMWHPQGSGIVKYPTDSDGADRTDMVFAKQWIRDKRELIPELVGIHLDSENATMTSMGKNWNGRKTNYFGYHPPKKRKKFLFF
jgi:hypothetical protein